MTIWQEQFNNRFNYIGLTIKIIPKGKIRDYFIELDKKRLEQIKQFFFTLLQSQAKEIEIWARKNKVSEENGDVVGLGQLIEKLNSLK